MRTKIHALMVVTGLLASLEIPVFAQENHSKMGKMSGMKMSHDEMMARIEKMSTDDKAALIDKMPVKDKQAATKTAGKDVTKMSAQEKADMFDKMPMEKKMAMINGGPMMQKGAKMGKAHK